MELKAVDFGRIWQCSFSQHVRNKILGKKKCYMKKKEVMFSRFCILCTVKPIKKCSFFIKSWVKIRGKFIDYSLPCLECWLNHYLLIALPRMFYHLCGCFSHVTECNRILQLKRISN